MFTGTAVTVEPGETAKVDSLLATGDSVLWLQQKLEGKKTGTVWIGTLENNASHWREPSPTIPADANRCLKNYSCNLWPARRTCSAPEWITRSSVEIRETTRLLLTWRHSMPSG